MPRVLIAGAQQEISTFNHVFCDYDFFTKMWGDEIVDKNRGQNTEVSGAIEALEQMPGMELVPTYNAGAGSAGPLEHASSARIGDPASMVALGDLYSYLGRSEDAAEYVGQALALGTRKASFYFHAGMIYSAIGDEGLDREYLELALGINPHFSLIFADEARAELARLESASEA